MPAAAHIEDFAQEAIHETWRQTGSWRPTNEFLRATARKIVKQELWSRKSSHAEAELLEEMATRQQIVLARELTDSEWYDLAHSASGKSFGQQNRLDGKFGCEAMETYVEGAATSAEFRKELSLSDSATAAEASRIEASIATVPRADWLEAEYLRL